LDAGAQLGVTGPGCCLQPGTTSSFFARWLGNDLPGTATLWGETFTGLGNPSRPNNASIEYQSSMFSLPSTGGTSLTITAPFMLNGLLFGRSPTDGTQVAASFIGSGTGMMPLTWIPSLDAWASGTVQEQVSTPPGLVPETCAPADHCHQQRGTPNISATMGRARKETDFGRGQPKTKCPRHYS
jgi:hypothetical protein